MDLDNENPWRGILSSTMFAIRLTVHTINQEANLQLSKQRKQALINKGNKKNRCR